MGKYGEDSKLIYDLDDQVHITYCLFTSWLVELISWQTFFFSLDRNIVRKKNTSIKVVISFYF
jgi:hypothetical protein